MPKEIKTKKTPKKTSPKPISKQVNQRSSKKAPADLPVKPAIAKKPRISNRKQKRDDPNSPENLKIEQRRSLVLDLKIGGASVRTISEHLKKQGYDASIGTIQNDLEICLGDLLESKSIKTDKWRELELLTIGKLWLPVFTEYMQWSDFSINGVFAWMALGQYLGSLMEKRAKYLGLFKPVEVKVDARELLAKLTGRKPEDFPTPMSNE